MAAETPKMSVEDNATGISPGKMEESAYTGVPFFDRLPLELREKIYFLAYVADGDKVVKITSVMEIVERERSRRRGATIVLNLGLQPSQLGVMDPQLTIGTCPLFQMMVNRQFFEESSATWLRSVTFQGQNTHTTAFTTYCARSPTLKGTLTSVNITDWPEGLDYRSSGGGASFAEMMLECRGLRFLQVRVPERAFNAIAKIPCVHDLTSADFQSLEPVQDILTSTSLQRVEAIAEPSEEACTEVEHTKWAANVKALEEYINQQIEARQAKREQHAHSSTSDTNFEKVIPPTKPAQPYSSPLSSESAIAQKMLDDLKDKFRIGATQKQPQVMGREALEEKVSRMEEEMKVLKERLDAITGFKTA